MKVSLFLILNLFSINYCYSQHFLEKQRQIRAVFEDSIYLKGQWLNQQLNTDNEKKTRQTGYRLKSSSVYNDLQWSLPKDSINYTYSGYAGSTQDFEFMTIYKDYDEESFYTHNGIWNIQNKNIIIRNANLQVIKRVWLKWNSVTSNWDSLQKRDFIYNGNNQLVQETWMDRYNSSWRNNTNYDYFYSNNHVDSSWQKVWDTTSVSWKNKTMVQWSYTAGLISEQIVRNWHVNSSSWRNSNKAEYQYAGGIITEVFHFNWWNSQGIWLTGEREVRQYNSDNKIIDASQYSWDSTTSTWNHRSQFSTLFIGKMFDTTFYRYKNASDTGWFYDYSSKHQKNSNNLTSNLISYFGDSNTTSTSGWKLKYKDSINYFNDTLFNQYINYYWDGNNFIFDTTFSGVTNYFYEPHTVALTTEENNELFNIRYYPNPTNGKLFLELDNDGAKDFTFTVFDFFGRIIKYEKMEGYIGNYLIPISLEQFPSSTYLIQIAQNGKVIHVGKVIKQ